MRFRHSRPRRRPHIPPPSRAEHIVGEFRLGLSVNLQSIGSNRASCIPHKTPLEKGCIHEMCGTAWFPDLCPGDGSDHGLFRRCNYTPCTGHHARGSTCRSSDGLDRMQHGFIPHLTMSTCLNPTMHTHLPKNAASHQPRCPGSIRTMSLVGVPLNMIGVMQTARRRP